MVLKATSSTSGPHRKSQSLWPMRAGACVQLLAVLFGKPAAPENITRALSKPPSLSAVERTYGPRARGRCQLPTSLILAGAAVPLLVSYPPCYSGSITWSSCFSIEFPCFPMAFDAWFRYYTPAALQVKVTRRTQKHPGIKRGKQEETAISRRGVLCMCLRVLIPALSSRGDMGVRVRRCGRAPGSRTIP
jgi:hypothetical protein